MTKRIILIGGITFLIILIIILLIYTGGKEVHTDKRGEHKADTVVVQPGPGQGIVQVQMENVKYRIDTSIVLMIKKLRGELIAVKKEGYPIFDKKDSYKLKIFSAEISIDMKSLSSLLNHYVFSYEGSAISDIKVTTEGNLLKQEGEIKGIPFTAKSELSVTSDGKIRLHSVDMKAIGIEMSGLMDFFSIELDELIKSNRDYGAVIKGNDFLLDPQKMLPPPRIEGTLDSVKLGKTSLTQIYKSANVRDLRLPIHAKNYMFYYGGRLGFGNLTMYKADMFITARDQDDPFDFFLDHYFEQLTAGYHITTADDGLIIYMPDYSKLKKEH